MLYTRRYWVILLITCIFFANSISQDIYGTTNGIIEVSGVWNGNNLVATSHQLQVDLNYETAEIKMKLDKSTLRTGIDSLDNLLRALRGDLLTYDGKLGVDFIMTKKHPKQQFDVSGTLSCVHNENDVQGSGRLEHIEAELYSCVLTMSFEMSLSETNLEIQLLGLEDRFRISIMQIVLKRDTD